MIKKIKTHVKIGDKIKVISGDQKGFIGNIVSLNRKKERAIIDGILPRIKYVKNRNDENSTKTEIPISIHISNLMIWDEKSNSSSRIGYKMVDNTKKRYFKKSGNLV